MILLLCISTNDALCTEFLKNVFSGFKVTEWTRFLYSKV